VLFTGDIDVYSPMIIAIRFTLPRFSVGLAALGLVHSH
jgi:hypothetical protein